ncbi:MAG: hypothetical protein MJE68_18690 [Proteobacteria bacterium]|nr:hypothetical protein [Pseudomonadota bacterium]
MAQERSLKTLLLFLFDLIPSSISLTMMKSVLRRLPEDQLVGQDLEPPASVHVPYLLHHLLHCQYSPRPLLKRSSLDESTAICH